LVQLAQDAGRLSLLLLAVAARHWP
jgi:hypothetical protein